jgi:hypothetical protein
LEAIDDSAGNLSAFYKLAADIDLGGSATPWTPLTGTFTGSLDGDYHTVSDAYLSIATSSPVNIGLFGVIGSGARFTKLRLLDFDFQSTSTEDTTTSFGTLAGATSGTITANEIIVENSVLSGPISNGGILFGGGWHHKPRRLVDANFQLLHYFYSVFHFGCIHRRPNW